MLNDVLDASKLLKEEKKITSRNLALVLLHDLLLAKGIQASEGPVKQAILRHKTRLHSEFTRIKIKKGVKSVTELAATGDERAGARSLDLVIRSLGANYLRSQNTSLCTYQYVLLVDRGGRRDLHSPWLQPGWSFRP